MLSSDYLLVSYYLMHQCMYIIYVSAAASAVIRVINSFLQYSGLNISRRVLNLIVNVFYIYISLLIMLVFLLGFIAYSAYFNLQDINISTHSVSFNYSFIKYTSAYFNTDFSFFSLIIMFLAIFIGFFAFFTLDNRYSAHKHSYGMYYFYFLTIVSLLISTPSYVMFFIYYECLLIPSFFFVYYISYSRRAILASLYFVIWTQVGSLLVLCAVLYIYSLIGSSLFRDLNNFNFRLSEIYTIYCLIFFGFGFKVPIWPFHYWLTKTHVEAPTGFSIYLSGFLVKSAVFGFFKFNVFLYGDISTVFSWVFCIVGAIDASLKMWGQSDLKKLVAYCTIQEMNLMFLCFMWGDGIPAIVGFLFMLVHAGLSSLMFYVVDCVFRRYNSRSIFLVNGIINYYPNLATSIFIMILLFGGIPGTGKFLIELWIYIYIFNTSWVLFLIVLFIINVFGLVGFAKIWFNAVYGISNSKFSKKLDLSKKEFYIIMIFTSFLVIVPYFYFMW